MLRTLLCLALVGGGCSKGLALDAGSPPDLAVAPDLAMPVDLAWDPSLVQMRPYMSKAPAGYDKSKATPFVLALHGLGDTGDGLAMGAGLLALADQRGFLLAYPDGAPTGFGGGYWNANDVCCMLSNPVPDDVAYLRAVLSDMASRYNVDPKRVFVIGLSNGGMMAHRLACDLSWRIAAIVSLSGVQYTDPAPCKPSDPISVLEVHGTADKTIPYDGGPTLMGLGPHANSAHQTIEVWVDRNGCMKTPDTTAPPVDVDGSIAGPETTMEKYPGCKPGGATELWTVKGGMHIPRFAAGAPGMFYDWMLAHARQ